MIPNRLRESTLVACIVLAALGLVPGALASHQFTDVPDGAPFHNEIGIFKDTNITSGCTATTFCPGNTVLRQAMAAFIVRGLGLVVRPGETTQKGIPGSRVAMLDDDLSLIGTDGNVLRLRGPNDNIVGGFSGNTVSAGVTGATIAGGGGSFLEHSVTAGYGTVGGGLVNTASGLYSTVAGGETNTASGNRATVGGGGSNTASVSYSTVSGGHSNMASDFYGTVGGGVGNTASGSFSTVGGGGFNDAAGDYSFAAGRRAQADHSGAFVWADSTDADFASTAVNQFNTRARGGYRFLADTGGCTIAPNGTMACPLFTGVFSGTCACTVVSDRAAKRELAPVNRQALLRRLARIPITSWSYRTEPTGVRHLGPMAQDFRAAFGLGADGKHIATVDADGVALAAIQALHRENLALRREVNSLKRQNARLVAVERGLAELRLSR